jgi:hypothetical protein
MATTITISLVVPSNQATVQAKMRLVPGFSPQSFMEIGKYFEAISGGAYAGNATVTIGAASPVVVYNGY